MFRSVVNTAKSQFGKTNKQAELTALQAKVREEIQGLRNLISGSNLLTPAAKSALMAQVADYEANKADVFLNLGAYVGDFHATWEEWASIEKQAGSLSPIFQALLMGYNTQLNALLDNNDERLSDVFAAKRGVYKQLNEANLDKIVSEDRKRLVELNAGLTARAETIFADKTRVDAGSVNQIFDAKKTMAKYRLGLEAPQADLNDNELEPLMTSIEGLKNYLTNESNGRYRNTAETTNVFGFGVSRTTKLAETIRYCDQIVLGQPLSSSWALTHGNLGVTVTGFMARLTDFFSTFLARFRAQATPATTISAPTTALLGESQSNQPSDTGSSDGDSWDNVSVSSQPTVMLSRPSVPTVNGKDLTVNTLCNEIMAVLPTAPAPDSLQNGWLASFAKQIETYHAETKIAPQNSSEVVLKCAKVVIGAPFYDQGKAHLERLCAHEKALVNQMYENKPPLSVQRFMDGLSTYCLEKYQETSKDGASRKKLYHAIHCFDVLMKDSTPQTTLANYKNNALDAPLFKRSRLKDLVGEFITARTAELASQKNAAASNGSNAAQHAIGDHERRQNKSAK